MAEEAEAALHGGGGDLGGGGAQHLLHRRLLRAHAAEEGRWRVAAAAAVWEMGYWGCAGVVCAAAAKDCAAAGRVGEDCQVDWGLRLALVTDYCMTSGTSMSGDVWLSVVLFCGST